MRRCWEEGPEKPVKGQKKKKKGAVGSRVDAETDQWTNTLG